MDLVVTVEGKNYPITLVQEPTASPAAGAGAPTHPATPSLEETDECEVVIKQDDGQERRVKVNYQWQLDSPIFSAIVEYVPQPHTPDRTHARIADVISVCVLCVRSGKDVTMQLAQALPVGYRLVHLGTKFDVLVRTPRQAELAVLMPKPVVQTKHQKSANLV